MNVLLSILLVAVPSRSTRGSQERRESLIAQPHADRNQFATFAWESRRQLAKDPEQQRMT